MASNQPRPDKELKHAPGKKQAEHLHRGKGNDRDTGHAGNRDRANPSDRDRRMVREEQR